MYEIKNIENYFISDINERKTYSKKLNRYVTIFEYIDKILIILSATTSGISIISFTSVIGTSVGIVSASFTLIFYLSTGITKKLLNMTRKKKKMHDKILLLVESKFNSIETLISQASNDLDISHEEFTMILNGKDKYKKIKYSLISKDGDEKQETTKISSI